MADLPQNMASPANLRPFGRVHIVGIGGIGMSGIAEIMHNMGYQVQGSDMTDNANVERLRAMGIEVMIGHRGENVANAGVVTVSSAVAADNPEVQAARAAHIPVVPRAEMLAELMRLKPCITIAGTHGKTTTTSLTAAVLDAGHIDPTVINGGIINAYGTNARLGQGGWMVVEADESDGTFVRLPATMAIVTNIDPEHLEHYGDFDGLRQAFERYVQNIPFYGLAILCLDHPEVQALVGRIHDRRIVTYGLNDQADLRAVNIVENGLTQNFDVIMRDRRNGEETRITDISLPMAGVTICKMRWPPLPPVWKSMLRRRKFARRWPVLPVLNAASALLARRAGCRFSTIMPIIRLKSPPCSKAPARSPRVG